MLWHSRLLHVEHDAIFTPCYDIADCYTSNTIPFSFHVIAWPTVTRRTLWPFSLHVIAWPTVTRRTLWPFSLHVIA